MLTRYSTKYTAQQEASEHMLTRWLRRGGCRRQGDDRARATEAAVLLAVLVRDLVRHGGWVVTEVVLVEVGALEVRGLVVTTSITGRLCASEKCR